jgi:branched-subunit amino acid transport protein
LVFSAICLLGGLVFQSLLGTDSSGGGTIGLLASVTGAAALVCGIVAWIGGVALALRAGSTLWLVVAVLPFVPINSMMTAMFCPTVPNDRRR